MLHQRIDPADWVRRSRSAVFRAKHYKEISPRAYDEASLLQPPGCRPKRLGRLAERGLAVGAGESFPPASQQFVQVSFQGSHSLIIRIKMRLLVLFAYAWECLRRGMATVCGPRMKSQAKFVSDAKSPISPRTSWTSAGRPIPGLATSDLCADCVRNQPNSPKRVEWVQTSL